MQAERHLTNETMALAQAGLLGSNTRSPPRYAEESPALPQEPVEPPLR